MARQGLVSFPGVPDDFIVAGQYTRGHGISPGTAQLTVVPNTKVSKGIGDLVFSFDKVKIKIPGCAIVDGRATVSTTAPTTWQIRLLDRRWAWQYSKVSGRYNVRKQNGDVDTKTFKEKTPRELAEICLKAMDESGYDTSKLPNETRPKIEWEDARADVELEKLCTSLGCRVVYCLDDKVRLLPQGTGKSLPTDESAINLSVNHERAATPGKLEVVCPATVFEAKWELEAVGEDTDGDIKVPDELSYKPEGGWGLPEAVDPDATYTRDGAEKKVIDLARKTVGKYFRIKKLISDPFGGILTPTFGGKLISGSILLVSFNDHLARADDDGKYPPAILEGVFVDDDLATAGFRTEEGTAWPGTFTIDKERRLVILGPDGDSFGAYNTAAADDATIEFAKLVLHTSFTVLDPADGATIRHSTDRELGKNPGTKTIKSEVPLIVRETYSAPRTFKAVSTNRPTLDAELKSLLDLEQKRLQAHQSGDIEYEGLRDDIELDGAISQITFRVGGLQPAVTRVGRNTEPVVSQPPYEERRRIERAKADEATGFFVDLASKVTSLVSSFLPPS